MYKTHTTQEQKHKDFFYPKEDMGTTIMAIKYDGGVIACADTRKPSNTQEPQQEESMSSIESLIRSILFMTISSLSEQVLPDSRNKQSISWDSSSILMSTNKENCLMSKLQQECSKKLTIKRVLRLDTFALVGILMMDLRFIPSILVVHACFGTMPLLDRAVASFMATSMLTTRKIWALRRQKHSALTQFLLPWEETDLQEVSFVCPTSPKEAWRRSIITTIACPTSPAENDH